MAKRKGSKVDSSSKKSKRSVDEEDAPPVALPFCPADFNATRARVLTETNRLNDGGNCVILWMSRDQRAEDNHALHYAQGVAKSAGVPVKVVFNLLPSFLEATLRQYSFMIEGLREVEENLRRKGIPLHLIQGNPVETIPAFVEKHDAMVLVTDFSPLRVSKSWTASVASSLDATPKKKVPLVQVDAHNIVPCWVTSPKLEYGARTIRSKIQRLMPEYLKPIPELEANPIGSLDSEPVDWSAVLDSLQIDKSVAPVTWIKPGAAAAFEMLQSFIDKRMKIYGDKRNDPNEDALSNMSPYFHFGHISVQRAVLEVKMSKKHASSADGFIEEAVVRRELSDNFCFYNENYDSLDGCYDWAKETLRMHSSDPREFNYSFEELEQAMTHDDLWNAAQLQMTKEGKMHGFLRMYWAKKILEWTPSPEEALSIAIHLNDKYELDGRDPNGYVGCMWSIGGIHDQGWGERPIFGKIRFMNYQGCKRKFDVAKFVSKYPPAAKNAAMHGGADSSSSSKGKKSKK